jgi:hypothetical protein
VLFKNSKQSKSIYHEKSKSDSTVKIRQQRDIQGNGHRYVDTGDVNPGSDDPKFDPGARVK